jgi:hypothetical protein
MTRARDVADTQDNLGGAVAPVVGGKNVVVNGGYDYWQRATTFTAVGTNGYYTADRWKSTASVTSTMSQNVIAPGTSGIDETLRFGVDLTGGTVSTGGYHYWDTPIEDVRTLANTTATLSFYAKGSVAGTIATRLTQSFGTGGSTGVYCVNANTGVVGGVVNLTTSWQRFSITYIIPSVNGKTISATDSTLGITFVKGLGSSYTPTTYGIPSSVDFTGTLSIAGVMLEAGTQATRFSRTAGSIGGELALCQRYYQKSYPANIYPGAFFQGGYSTTIVENNIPNNNYFHYQPLIVQMRAEPTITIYSGGGATAKVSTTAGSDLAANSAVPILPTDNHFTIQNQSGGALSASAGAFLFYYIASAEF